MVHVFVSIAIRCLTILCAAIALATASNRHIKTCTFGDDLYSSEHQVNFFIAVNIIVIVGVALHLLMFSILKKRPLPSLMAQLCFDGINMVLTFAGAITMALSPVGNEICTSDNDLKTIMQQMCDFSCSNVVASVVMTFLAFTCFLLSLLITAKVIPTHNQRPPAEEDYKPVVTPANAMNNAGAIQV